MANLNLAVERAELVASAHSASILTNRDTEMNTNDFNYGQQIFLASFLCAELPSGLVSKKLGADRWIPFLIIAWSITSASQVGLKSKAGYYAVRCILGLLMGGFIPDIVLWLTYFFVRILPLCRNDFRLIFLRNQANFRRVLRGSGPP